jgi:hypothetical protein
MEGFLSEPDRKLRWTITGILIVIVLGGALDLALDQPATLWSFHVLFELGILSFSLGAAAYLWLGWRRTGDSLDRTQRKSQSHAAERDAWRTRAEKLLLGLGEGIDRQLREWELNTGRTRDGAPHPEGLWAQGNRRAPDEKRAHGAPARHRCVPEVWPFWTCRTLGLLSRGPSTPGKRFAG